MQVGWKNIRAAPQPVLFLRRSSVPHRVFHDKGAEWFCSMVERPGVLIDVKGVFQEELDEVKNLTYWSL